MIKTRMMMIWLVGWLVGCDDKKVKFPLSKIKQKSTIPTIELVSSGINIIRHSFIVIIILIPC
ncbi:hypothetical protein DERP_010225 [Dermatophagoides pteronyssinus]|uniref:Lipoprotein n=1 Tax=Dermatophagoides pteronyssinus TaxID=6956 RepID=A0ABQ8J712_DERPT|nr:hypothetical protein DERP_010225 [Dermatophagoides pteronyssinus]